MSFLSIFCQFCRMSLYIQKEIGKKGRLGIWRITESVEELLKLKAFSTQDLSVLGSFAYEQRKKEWLAARILVERLIDEKDVRIVYDEYNKPALGQSDKHISLSHSHDLLAITVNEAVTGIDIELIKPKIINIKHKFMSQAESNSMQAANMAEQLTIYWCVKESLYKLYGKKELEFKKNLLVEPFEYSEKGIIKGWIKNSIVNQRFSLQYEKLKLGDSNYMLAYVIGQD